MSDLLQAGQHPDADQLSAFVEDALPAHQRRQTMAHLADCASCRQVIGLSLPPLEQPEVVRRPWPSRPWLPRWRLAWAGVPALAVLILLVVFLRSGRVVPRPAPGATQMAVVPSAVPPPAPAPPQLASRSQITRMQGLPRKRAEPPASPSIGGGNASGVMGGILGGIGTAPAPPLSQSFDVAVSSASSAYALARHAARDVLPAATGLPSQLAAISMVSNGSQRLAIDTSNHLFFSADDGKHWKQVQPQWEGRAVRVALAGSSPGEADSLAVSSLPAASATGSISGTITDPTGAFIPGATVVAIDANGNVLRTVTDQQGQFHLKNLGGSGYRIEAEAPGFEKQSLVAEIGTSQQAVVDLTLRPASAAQSVMVQSAPAALGKLSTPAQQDGGQFELTTDDGSRWLSTDGQNWKRE